MYDDDEMCTLAHGPANTYWTVPHVCISFPAVGPPVSVISPAAACDLLCTRLR